MPKLNQEQSFDDYIREEQERQTMLKMHLQSDHLAFTQYFLNKRDGNKFKTSPHHSLMAETLERVFTGEITRLIINVPPGYTKTEMAVINFISRGLAKHPASKYIHVSYSDQLASTNSSSVRDVMKLEEYEELWPKSSKLRRDSSAKKYWFNTSGGGMYAVSAGGAITGFRAGRMVEGFSGAFIIDDPLKPDDAYSETKRNAVNERFNGTFKSRLAHDKVPIIIIMQRIHEDDPTGFLLKGGTGEKWHHLCLPFEIPDPMDEKEYPKEYTHGIPIEYDLLPGPLWPYKKSQDDIITMRDCDPYNTASQYDQNPVPLGGALFKDKWWKYYKLGTVIPEYRFITGDTAQEIKEHNDFSVFQCWGVKEGNLYLLDQVRGKWESPELRRTAKEFWIKHYGTGQAMTNNRLRAMHIEKKSSGSGLIQDLKALVDPPIPIFPIERNRDKVSRSMDMIPYIASGRVFIPEDAEFTSDFKNEFAKFTPLMTHANDDQIDPTLDAIDIALRPAKKKGGTW